MHVVLLEQAGLPLFGGLADLGERDRRDLVGEHGQLDVPGRIVVVERRMDGGRSTGWSVPGTQCDRRIGFFRPDVQVLAQNLRSSAEPIVLLANGHQRCVGIGSAFGQFDEELPVAFPFGQFVFLCV